MLGRERLTVKDSIFTTVGSDDHVGTLKGANTRRVDLRGRTVIPGFIDSDNHIRVLETFVGGTSVWQAPYRRDGTATTGRRDPLRRR